jgi:hypothetical protein
LRRNIQKAIFADSHQLINPSTYQPINSSTYQPINLSTYQPINLIVLPSLIMASPINDPCFPVVCSVKLTLPKSLKNMVPELAEGIKVIHTPPSSLRRGRRVEETSRIP